MIRRTALVIVSIFAFVLSLQMIQAGALPMAEILRPSNGPVACLGLGWFLACLVLSGSPVAATSLAFLASDILNVHESFAMIIGSRLGASLVVLVIGLVYETRSDGQKGGVYVGVLAFLITATVYLPAMALGYICINTGWLDVIHVPGSFPLVSVIDQIFSPIVDLVIAGCDVASLPKWTLSVAGIGVMVFAFKLFDLTLPTGDPLGGRIGQMSRMIFRPSVAFLVGMLLTCITLSVSVSLALLVPLTARGVIRRENLIPFILGANITTFVDTLVFSLLIDHPAAFALVLCSAVTVSAISLPVVFFAYRPYERIIDEVAGVIVERRWRLTLFVLALFIVPVLLIALPL